MPRLPPLPPITSWKSLWPRTILRYSMDKTNREFNGRVLLANPKIANDFVRALRLRENEVVIEAFPGPGLLTRALLSGGTSEHLDLEQAVIKEGRMEDESDRVGRSTDINKPAVVVACEPSPQILVQGLGMSINDQPGEIPAMFESETFNIYESRVHQSEHEERLLLSPSTPYRWPTLVQLLGHPLVTTHMPIYDGGGLKEEDRARGQRPWDAPRPGITIVAQIPQSVAGDQMVSQWIGSAVGNSSLERTWIWQWGRLRLALLVGKNQYDRMMAGPGETIHCKLSVMTRALFNVSALPPYHHVYNVDKSSTRTEDTPIGKSIARNKKKESTSIPIPPQIHPHTTTYPDDFYPITIGRGKHLDIPLPRPEALGILLEPKLDSPINLDNKDEWDYVLRKCFVTEAQSIKIALKNLAFGAEGLMGKIDGSVESKNGFKGRNVPSDRIVRDMDVEEWTRIVDVFGKWAFKPDNLILDSRPDDEAVRQIGQD